MQRTSLLDSPTLSSSVQPHPEETFSRSTHADCCAEKCAGPLLQKIPSSAITIACQWNLSFSFFFNILHQGVRRLVTFKDTRNSVPVPSLTSSYDLGLPVRARPSQWRSRCDWTRMAAPAIPIGRIKLFMELKTSVGSSRLTVSVLEYIPCDVTWSPRVYGALLTKTACKNCKIFNKRDARTFTIVSLLLQWFFHSNDKIEFFA